MQGKRKKGTRGLTLGSSVVAEEGWGERDDWRERDDDTEEEVTLFQKDGVKKKGKHAKEEKSTCLYRKKYRKNIDSKLN